MKTKAIGKAGRIPGSPKKLLERAVSLMHSDRREDAISELRQLLTHFPANVDGNFYLGTFLAELGSLDEAEKFLSTAGKLAPRSPQIFNNLGNVLRMKGQNEAALACYQRVTRLDPGFVPAWMNLGLIHATLGNWKEVIASLSQVNAEMIGDPDVLCRLGRAYRELGDYDAARRSYQRALACDPSDRYGATLALAAFGALALPARHSDATVKEIYRTKAEHWDTDVTRPNDTYRGPVLIRELLSSGWADSPPQALSILDLGCGTGACGEFLASWARELVGVDLSPDMLAVARRKGNYGQLVEAEIGDYLAGSNECFDLIVAAGVLIMFSRLESILERIRARSGSQGLFAFTLYRSGEEPIEIRQNHHFGHSRSYLDEVIARTGWTPLDIRETVHETADGIPQAGFAVLLRRS
jgi:predicted TPR repeat methyltransferase